MLDIVDLIDEHSGYHWRYRKPRERHIRLKKPLSEKYPPEPEGEFDDHGELVENTGMRKMDIYDILKTTHFRYGRILLINSTWK